MLISLQMHLFIYLIPAGLVPVGLDTEHTSVSVSWYYPLTVITVASLVSLFSQSLKYMFTAISSTSDGLTVLEKTNKVNNEMNSKNLPQT